MARPKLSGAGQQRIKSLEDAIVHVQNLHAIVERMALAQKQAQPIFPFIQQLKRAAVPVTDTLKGQFGPIADQVTPMILRAPRGGNDRSRINSLREGIGGIKSAIDIATRKVYEVYADEGEGATSGE